MNVTMQKIGNVSARLTVSVVEADYKEKVDKELRKFGREREIPGFRKGHVPFNELRRRFGKEMTSDVLNNVVYEAVVNYLRDNKVDILGEPLPVDVKELDLAHEKDFTFEYELGLAPDLTFTVGKEDKVPYYTIEVTEDMINEQDQAFRKRFGAQVPGEEFEHDALVKGVLMELNEDGSIKEGEGAVQVVDGIVGPMFFKSKAEADKFIGAKVGDKIVFNPWESCQGDPVELSSMLHVDKAQAADIKANFELAISEIIVVRLAELNEEFYTNVFGADKVHNEEEYRAAIKAMIADQLENNSRQLFAATIKKQLMDRYGNFELPDDILKKWLARRNPEADVEALDKDYVNMQDDIRWQLVASHIARQLNVEVNEDDMLAFAKMMAARQFAQYGMTNLDDETITKYARSILDDKNYRSRLYDQVFDGKFFQTLENAVTLEKEEVTLDRFKEIANAL